LFTLITKSTTTTTGNENVSK